MQYSRFHTALTVPHVWRVRCWIQQCCPLACCLLSKLFQRLTRTLAKKNRNQNLMTRVSYFQGWMDRPLPRPYSETTVGVYPQIIAPPPGYEPHPVSAYSRLAEHTCISLDIVLPHWKYRVQSRQKISSWTLHVSCRIVRQSSWKLK